MRKIKSDKIKNEINPGKKRKNKRKMKFIKFVILTVLILTGIILISMSSLFNISKIEVKGNKHYKSQDIISGIQISTGNNAFKTMGLKPGNILLLRYHDEEARIVKNHPYVKSAVVRLKIPNKVEVEIVEREPVCIIKYLGTNLLMDREGYILDNVDKVEPYRLPTVKGLSFDRYELGQALKVTKSDSVKELVGLLDTFRKSDEKNNYKLYPQISMVDISDTNRQLVIIDNRINVNLGDLTDLDYRINFLREILDKKISKSEKGTLDFSSGQNPSFTPER